MQSRRYAQIWTLYINHSTTCIYCFGFLVFLELLGTRIGFGRSNYGKLPGANSDIEGLAATIVHETCHFHQGHTRKKLEIKHKDDKSTSVREAQCYERGESFLSALHSGEGVEHASEYGIYQDFIQE